MKNALVVLVLLSIASPAWADPADLSGGALIAHSVPGVMYCMDPPAGGWCDVYASQAISSLEEVNAQLQSAVFPGTNWYVIAAWLCENKTWCGTEFGLDEYDPTPYYFIEWSPCFPVAGLEIPTTNWPGPQEGTAFVTTGTPWSGNYVPVYWFGGYAYDASYGVTIMPIGIDPPTGFCGFSNCQNPPASFTVGHVQRGGMGVNTPGIVPAWPVPPEPGACCLPQPPFCLDLLEQECLAIGGEWHEGETCATYPCPTWAACCIGGICEMLFEENCILLGGAWNPGVTCQPNPCPAVCCYALPAGHGCIITVEAECAVISGYWHPEWTSCEPNPCDIYTPAGNTSWGEIKNMYR